MRRLLYEAFAFTVICAGLPAIVWLMLAALTAIDPSRVPQ